MTRGPQRADKIIAVLKLADQQAPGDGVGLGHRHLCTKQSTRCYSQQLQNKVRKGLAGWLAGSCKKGGEDAVGSL